MKETLLDTTYRRQTKKLRTKTESLWAIMGGPTAWGTGSALHVVKVHFYSQFLSKKHTYVFPTIISIIHHKFLDICAFSIQMLLDLKLGQISAENLHAVRMRAHPIQGPAGFSIISRNVIWESIGMTRGLPPQHTGSVLRKHFPCHGIFMTMDKPSLHGSLDRPYNHLSNQIKFINHFCV